MGNNHENETFSLKNHYCCFYSNVNHVKLHSIIDYNDISEPQIDIWYEVIVLASILNAWYEI